MWQNEPYKNKKMLKGYIKRIPDWKQLLSVVGNRGIVQNIPFILYCSFLGIIYITINHLAENRIRKINSTAKDLKELRWRYVDIKSQIMYLTKESELAKHVVNMGLQKTKVPPYKIHIELSNHENE